MASTHSGIAHQPRGQSTIKYLPLEEVKVKAWVVDVSSRILLMQTFCNPSNEPTGRAKYIFPLPANAAVCAFDLELQDGSVIVGEVKEKEEAALEFAHAAGEGKAAALVEHVTDDIFTILIGSIPASTRVTAHLTFVMDLLDEALRDHVRLQLPMYIAKRHGTPPVAVRNTSAADSHTRLHISVNIQTSDAIYNIQSPTHHISRRRYKGRSDQISRRRMSAVMESAEFLTRDFVITIHAEGLDKPRCFAEVLDERRDTGGEGSTIALQLTLVPKLLAPRVTSQEYIFIIDRSTSMRNDPIETAKRTLSMLLRLLPADQTTFNVFSFGGVVQRLWQSSRPLNKTSLTEVISHVTRMSANLPGTEIPSALQTAFSSRGLDRPAAVFLLTDGQIHESKELDACQWVSSIVRNSPPAAPVRLFVLGIGAGVSSDVCSKLAQHGNGEYLFAVSAEYICGKCARLLNAGRSRNIESIDIDWGYDTSSLPPCSFTQATPSLPPGIPVLSPPPPIQQAPCPRSLTKFFSGIRFTVFAITSFSSVPTSVKLKTKVEGSAELQEWTVSVTKVKPFRDAFKDSIVPMVHTLAARKLIIELDDKDAPPPSQAPGDALLASEDDLWRAGIVRLGLTYQLVSEYTSFVAVQQGNERRMIRGHGSGNGSLAWAKSRLQRTNLYTQEDSPTDAPSLLDDLINGVSSFLGSILGFIGGSVASTSRVDQTSGSHSHHQRLPGTYGGSDSGSAASSSGRRRSGQSSPSPPRSRSPFNSSTRTFSTLSSLEGSSCISCWTSSRPSSPLPPSVDSLERAPSPGFQRNASNLDPTHAHVPRPVSSQVYHLFEQMDVDGSFKLSPLVIQVVGDAVLGKADELGIDRNIWATVVVVAYMTIHLQGEPYLLELVSQKAREFVEAALSGGDSGVRNFDEMLRNATTFLGE